MADCAISGDWSKVMSASFLHYEVVLSSFVIPDVLR